MDSEQSTVSPQQQNTVVSPEKSRFPYTVLFLLFGFCIVAIIAGGVGYMLAAKSNAKPAVAPSPSPILAIPTVQQGSIGKQCRSDAECPQAYMCEATVGQVVVMPDGQSSEVTPQIIEGVCKVRKGGSCASSADCSSGLLCHQTNNGNVCTEGITTQQCSGKGNTSCPQGYQCAQSCGSPVPYDGEPTPPYFCVANEIATKPRECPICLSSQTKIATPYGEVMVKDLKVGMSVWSTNEKGERISSKLVNVSNTVVPSNHTMIHLRLSDGRELFVSPRHPTIYGSPVSQIQQGDTYDGVIVSSIERVPYGDNKTYDLLSDSTTGYYWANGIPMASTLKQ